MSNLILVGIISYFIGSILFPVDGKKKHVLDFTKGYLILFFTGLFIDSGLSYVLASMGALAGHTRSCLHKFNGESTEFVALGILFYISPVMGLAILVFFLLSLYFVKNYKNCIFASSFLIAILSFKFFQKDAYVIICLIIFVSLSAHFWPSFLGKRIKHVSIARIGTGFGVLFLLILFFFNKYVYKGFGMQKDIIRQGPHHFKYVALTFDDGPDPIYTPEILDILEKKNVYATFFLIGKSVEQYPDIAKRIVDEGHSIGNHTYSHKSLIPLSKKATVHEIKKAEKAIEDATQVRPTLFRPPRGIYSSFARNFLMDERYTIALWDVSAMDWAEIEPNGIVSAVVKKTRPGSILLFHDSGDLITFKGGNRSHTVKALPYVIDELKSMGYEFITVDQMIFLSELMETEGAPCDDNIGRNPAY